MSQQITPTLFVGAPEEEEADWYHATNTDQGVIELCDGRTVYVDTYVEAWKILAALIDEEFADDQFALLQIPVPTFA